MGKKPKPSKAPPGAEPKVIPHPLHTPIKISFQLYVAGNPHCLSVSGRDDIRRFMDSLRMFTSMTWQQVRAQGGKPGNKAGLGYTNYSDHSLNVKRPDNVSPDLEIAGFRAGGAPRVFGVAMDNVFHVIWFDSNHRIVDG